MTAELVTLDNAAGPGLERVLVAGFLAGFREPTRSHYASILKQWLAWCHSNGFAADQAQRAHIELWARHLEEERGLKLSSVAGKLTAVCGMYKTAHMDGHLRENPARFVKRPQVSQDSTTQGLTRSELLAILDLAERTDPQDHAICCILGLNGLRVGELCSLRVEDVRRQGSYNAISFKREKSPDSAVVPLTPRTSGAVDKIIFGRTAGPLFLLRGEKPMDRRGVDRIVKRLAKKAGIDKRVHPHVFRHTFITLALDAGVSERNIQNSVGHRDPRQITRYDRNKNDLSRNATHMVSAYVEGS